MLKHLQTGNWGTTNRLEHFFLELCASSGAEASRVPFKPSPAALRCSRYTTWRLIVRSNPATLAHRSKAAPATGRLRINHFFYHRQVLGKPNFARNLFAW